MRDFVDLAKHKHRSLVFSVFVFFCLIWFLFLSLSILHSMEMCPMSTDGKKSGCCIFIFKTVHIYYLYLFFIRNLLFVLIFFLLLFQAILFNK